MMLKRVICLAAMLLAGASPAREAASPARGGDILLVGNKAEDTLSFIDLASGRELARLPTGRMPHEIAVSPDGRQAAVVSYGAAGIDIFDVPGRRKLRTIDLSSHQGPHGIAWLPDGRIVATTERSQSLTIVDPARGDQVQAVPTAQEGTHMVAVSADGRLAFTANIGGGTMSVIDLAASRKIRDVHVGGMPEGIALTPDGATLWVADLEQDRVAAFDARALAATDGSGLTPKIVIAVTLQDGSAEEIQRLLRPLEPDLRAVRGVSAIASLVKGSEGIVEVRLAPGSDVGEATRTITAALVRVGQRFPKGRTEAEVRPFGAIPLASVATGKRPIRVAVSPDGRWVVTSDFESGGLTVIDAATRVKVRDIRVSGSAEAAQVTILFSADGRRLYVAETGPDQVAEVDFASGRVLRRIPVGKDGDGLAIAR